MKKDKCPKCGKEKQVISKVCNLCRANTELFKCSNCGKIFHRSKKKKSGGKRGIRGKGCKTCSTRCSKERWRNGYKTK